jgi:hypothetical protein
MAFLPRAIQGLILFSTLLGVVFLWQAYPLLRSDAFYFVTFGWALFFLDSALTFYRPVASYYLGFVLAVLALGETLSQPAHFAIVSSGNLLASATIVLGSFAEVLLIILVLYYIVAARKKDPWGWPHGEGTTMADDQSD